MEKLQENIEFLKRTIEEQKKKLNELEQQIIGLNNYIRSIDINIEALDEREDAEAIQWYLDRKAEAIAERDRLLEEYRQLQSLIASNEEALAKLEAQVEKLKEEEEREKLTPEERIPHDIREIHETIEEGLGKITETVSQVVDPITALTNILSTKLDTLTANIQAFRTALGIPNIVKGLTEVITVDTIGNFATGVYSFVGKAMFAVITPLFIPLNAFISGIFQQIINTYTAKEAEYWKQPFKPVIQALFNNVTYEPPATYDKAIEAASKYLSVTVTLNNLTHLIGTALDSIGNLQIMGTKIGLRGFSRWAYSMNFVLGLNWLSWLVFSPLFKATVVDPLEQYYNQLYRSKVMSVSEAEEAFRNGIINMEEYKQVLKVHGYNDDSIEVMVHNVILKIVDRIEALEVQYADIEEDLGKILTVTLPGIEESISALENQIRTVEETLNKEKEYKLAELKARFQPKLQALEKDIERIAKPIEEKYRIEIERLEGLLKADLEKIEMEKEIAKTYEALYKLQLREYELVQEYEVKKKALLEKKDLEISRAIEKLKAEYDRLKQAFQLEVEGIELRYKKQLEEKTAKLQRQLENYRKQYNYYNTYKIPLLERKLKRIETQLKRLKEATLMSEPEKLLEEAYVQLKKQKKLVQTLDEKDKEKRKLQVK